MEESLVVLLTSLEDLLASDTIGVSDFLRNVLVNDRRDFFRRLLDCISELANCFRIATNKSYQIENFKEEF